MKLLNQTLRYISIATLIIISIWAFIFYFIILREIKNSIDEGLDNYKRQIIYNFQKKSGIETKTSFDEGFYTVEPISKHSAFSIRDTYTDTLLMMQDADDTSPEPEPVRMLTTSFEMDGSYYQMRIINSMVEEDDLVKAMFWYFVWLYLILIAGIIFTNNYALQRLWRPFYRLIQQLTNYNILKSDSFPEVKTRTTEFRDLQNAVRTLLAHNAETFEKQKQFISHASHELQTPLAIAINKLELLLEDENLSNKQTGHIADTIRTIERLSTVNKSLLLLSKIENKQFFDNRPVCINDIILQSVEEFEEFAAYKNVKISIVASDKLMVVMDESLARILVSNLLRNAIFHNIAGGKVFIEIKPDSLSFKNNGLRQALDSQRVFEAFYKDAANTSSTGLGLAILKSVCHLYRFNVNYRFEEELHVFEINF
ncbi:MAG TPA: HAMP domain-containing sensor histidine kinase [Saprospiraceae bacterium]|nr:HAMP domain-containing histidine kinase [Saprospiraceae bacterium]HMX82160.1 HAMP domain-containing sensor histidine kinase [Saprospiraceae bacterium]HND15430.1 HAMP domain-containing sensor histidine kinase [Saprospiraceae bacterium]HNE66008.1 HAMP domain-containing sensor histidine kinase [Saprospiraceae bacterium]HNG05630.1 HAMP domain-containing sensor histidine kinase [Saprospiraceae bacterium]